MTENTAPQTLAETLPAYEPEPLPQVAPAPPAAPEPVQAPALPVTPDVHDRVAAAVAARPVRRGLEILDSIPAKRWFLIRSRYGYVMDEALKDPTLVLVIAAVEHDLREQHGEPVQRARFEVYEEMTVEALAEYLGLNVDEDPDDADKSGDPSGAR